MKFILSLAIALINASPAEQELMVYDLYKADPVLAVDVLDVADELGADTDDLAIVIEIITDGGERGGACGSEDLAGNLGHLSTVLRSDGLAQGALR